VVFLSDNGASREGEALGTAQYLRTVIAGQIGDASKALARDLRQIDELGGPTTLPHYPRGWGMASGTPWRLYKQHTYAGGHTVPFVIAGPGIGAGGDGGDGGAGDVRFQYQHATDLLPTLVELAGVAVPTERHGVPVRPIHGSSFARALVEPETPSTHPEQHYAMLGHRGFYRDGWELVTNHQPFTAFGDHEWALFDLVNDPTELDDLAGQHPDRVAELSAAWETAAWAHDVFPLDEGAGIVWLTRPEDDERYRRPVTLRPGTPTLERWRSVQLIQTRAVRIEIEIDRRGDGVLVAHGGQGGGYSAYVEDGRLFVAYNEYGDLTTLDAGELADGPSSVVVDFAVRPGLRWAITVHVDGEQRAVIDDVAMLFAMAPFEGIDVGVDRRSPVSWPVHQRHGAFTFAGELRHVRYVPGDLAPEAPEAMLEILRGLGVAYE
jgi:hypothetical protein